LKSRGKDNWRQSLDEAARLWRTDDKYGAIRVLGKALENHPANPLLRLQKYYMENALQYANKRLEVQLPPRKTDDPSVSIVMATYNRNMWLPESIESVLNQTFKDLELIIVNDGGTDEAGEIARGYGDSRIRYAWREHGGLAAALNTGLARCRGKYVAFLDDDDIYYPEHIAGLAETLENHPNTVLAYSDYNWVRQEYNENSYTVTGAKQKGGQEFDPDLLHSRNYVVTVSAMARRDAIEKAGGFNESLLYCVHWDLWIRLSRLGGFIHVPEVTCENRHREDASNMSTNRAYRRTYFENLIFTIHKGFLLEGNMFAGKSGKRALSALEKLLESDPEMMDMINLKKMAETSKPYRYFYGLSKDFAREGDRRRERAALEAALRAAPYQPKLWFKLLAV